MKNLIDSFKNKLSEEKRKYLLLSTAVDKNPDQWTDEEKKTIEDFKERNERYRELFSSAVVGATASPTPLINNATAQYVTRLGQAVEKGYKPTIEDFDKVDKIFRSTLKGSKSTLAKTMKGTSFEQQLSNLRGMVNQQQASFLGESNKITSNTVSKGKYTKDLLGKFTGSKSQTPFNMPKINLNSTIPVGTHSSSVPAHQGALEVAVKNKDWTKVSGILDNIPATDPYKVSMEKLFRPMIQKNTTIPQPLGGATGINAYGKKVPTVY